jgi:hypothetical protein
VESYLRKQELLASKGVPDRPLHGCVIARRGKGIIIVDGTDKPSEIQFTIAHEVAHLLLDYQEPRMRALEKFGPAIEEVLDGQREATSEERVDALLANVPVRFYTHFMHRNDACATIEAESRADRLAFELLAPEEEVWRSLPKSFGQRVYEKRVAGLRRLLVCRFGLPGGAALNYASDLCRSRFGGASVREWLGIA